MGGGADRFAHEGMVKKSDWQSLDLVRPYAAAGNRRKSGSLCSASRSDDPAGPGKQQQNGGTFTKIGIGTFVDPRIEGED